MGKETFGRMEAVRGEKCSNPGYGARFTTPCCYADIEGEGDTNCPECGAPVSCEVEQEPVSVCRIRDEDEDEDE